MWSPSGPADCFTRTNPDWALLPTLETSWMAGQAAELDVLKVTDMFEPNALPLGFTARSGEIDPFQTYREELLTTPLWISLGGLGVGSISYRKS